MSDDTVLGTSCCFVPRRRYVRFVGALLFFAGLFHIFYFFLFEILWKYSAELVPRGCEGARCFDALSCGGLQEATWHIQEVLTVVGFAIVGAKGFLAAHHKVPEEMQVFGYSLAAYVVLLIVLFFGDGAYFLWCDAYPSNVIMQALLWPTRYTPWKDYPISQFKKHELHQMHAYPRELVNELAGIRVWGVYASVLVPILCFFAYTAYQALKLAGYMQYGIVGLGANYSISSWLNKKRMKDEIQDYMKDTKHMADRVANEDIDWRREDYEPGGEQWPGNRSSNPWDRMRPGAAGYGAAGGSTATGGYEQLPRVVL